MTNRFTLFPGGKSKVLTLSYDDGNIADRRLVDIFNRHGLRAAFHLNSAYLDKDNKVTRAELPSLYAGHEISCHSCTHPSLHQVSNEEMIRELLDDRRTLEDIAGAPIRGLSYPNGRFDDRVVEVVRLCGFAYARTTIATAAFGLPADPLRWATTGHHKHDILAKGRQFLEMPSGREANLFYVWGHSYEFDRENNWQLIEDFAAQMGNNNDLWYATNIDIIDYLAAVRRIISSVDGSMLSNPSAISVWVAHNGAPVEIPAGKTVKLDR
ncbi:MAG TPA: polysaccharide deacetylase family protein [Lentisphaeria bacterium]|nr:polysaccharide deacetylase family protein [Lentisphaeria bacterium]